MRKSKHFKAAMLAVLIATSTSPVIGAQIRIAEENAEIAATVSAREVSRISVEDDRIATLSAIPQGWTVDHDTETGDLFIVPNPGLLITGLVNMFITTEKGHTYQLLLDPRDIPSEQILIRKAKSPDEISVNLLNTPRREELGRLVRAVIKGELLEDYSRSAVSENTVLGNHPDLVPNEVWHGALFTAWRVSFVGNTPTPADIWGAAAVWISADGRNGVIVKEADNG
jgi:hypothetical protein